MKLQVCAIRDAAMNAFLPPMFGPTVAHITRNVSEAVNRKDDNSMLFAHPEDYELWHLGEFDDVDGTFAGDKVSVVQCKNLVRG